MAVSRLFSIAGRLMIGVALVGIVPEVCAQPAAPAGREWPVGSLRRLDQLPPGRLRGQLDVSPPAVRQRALQWLQSFHFSDQDLSSLHADARGGIFYVCAAMQAGPVEAAPPPVSGAAVPVSPFPSHLIFHSRPGAANVLYINHAGENVANTEWNIDLARTNIPALAFSLDSDYSNFSDAEQTAIKRIWQRMAEDFAPFEIDVTTERPATFNNRTAVALITRSTDANDDPNPYSTAGGVAYVNVFNTTTYADYRPAWVYYDNLASTESYIAEAASHEIGHNLGLGHDGKSDGAEYYNGHGSGDISWGPVMGTGYNRNVSQWCKGEYYLANNTQDDLDTIAGKVSYRADDHGDAPGSATALVVTGVTNVLSTTPETDPANTNANNKGVLDHNADVDVFTFVTGSGQIQLAVNPWITPSGTRGGNLDVRLELYNDAGTLLLTNNPDVQTTALIQTNLVGGRYDLYVMNSGAGDPFSSTPGGYTAYASLGQYFISGRIADPTGLIIPPLAQLQTTNFTQTGRSSNSFTVTYSDDVALSVSTIDSNDLRVTGPNGYDQLAGFVSLDTGGNGTPRIATYAITPPGGGVWLPVHNGTYTVFVRSNQVGDVEGAYMAAGQLGQLQVSVPTILHAANMDTDPGWTLEPDWQYGTPAYAGVGPTGGFTGTKIIAYNLGGNYANNLPAKYATMPAINCSGTTALTLRFKRWLRTRNNDPVSIQVSTNGATWTDVWSSSTAVSDASWQALQYPLPAGFAGSSSVRVRWSLVSSPSLTDIGWNLDDVELLGEGVTDTAPPVAVLSVANLTAGGSPSHPCSVTYTDTTAVRLAGLDGNDLLVTGPNGYSNLAAFVTADLPADGSPMTGAYSIPAPGGDWDAADNGNYTITLQGGEVSDTLNNAVVQTALGGFNVAIPVGPPGILNVQPAGNLDSAGVAGGPFAPSFLGYTLTNSGSSTLNWTAGSSGNWVSLSATAGSLAAGATSLVTVSLNTNANKLAGGNHSNIVSFVNTTSGNGNTNRTVNLAVSVQLAVTINNPAWGGVNPSNGIYSAGSVVNLLAAPAIYFHFQEWTGDATGTNNPLALLLDTNRTVLAVFAEILTTNHPTPLWWLAEQGYTNDVETAVTNLGANGIPLWQSYVAGLDPNNAQSQLLRTLRLSPDNGSFIVNWHTASNRLYTVTLSTNLTDGFTAIPGATDLPWTIQSFTNGLSGIETGRYYRINVRKP